MGRPRTPLDGEKIEELAARQWSIEEISSFFKVSRRTIERRFMSEIRRGKENGKAKLRDLQWKRALEGSDRVLIHMAKHYLDQHERGSEVNVTTVIADVQEKAKAAFDEYEKLKKESDTL